ncbi:MAG: hypothetical protein QXQ46_08900 [Thermoplasmatales archaeon]
MTAFGVAEFLCFIHREESVIKSKNIDLDYAGGPNLKLLTTNSCDLWVRLTGFAKNMIFGEDL